VCNVLNLAVGDFAMFGAIGTAWAGAEAGLPFIAGIVVDLVGVGLAAWLFDWVVLHPAFDRGRGARGIVGVFFYTFGLSLVLEGVARAWFGTDVWGAPAIWPGRRRCLWLDFHVQRAGILVIVLAIVERARPVAYLRFTVSGGRRAPVARACSGPGSSGSTTRSSGGGSFIGTRGARRAVRHRRVPAVRLHVPQRADDQPDRDRRRGVRGVPTARARGGDRAW